MFRPHLYSFRLSAAALGEIGLPHLSRCRSAHSKAFENLKTLVGLSDKYSDEIYCPVADVCNRLLFVDPPPAHKKPVPESDAKQIRDLIEEINKRLLTISLEQLATVGGLVLVAGTPAKATAIHKLLEDGELTHPKVHIQVVCTDSTTAALILDLARGPILGRLFLEKTQRSRPLRPLILWTIQAER